MQHLGVLELALTVTIRFRVVFLPFGASLKV
jgi:hypothetical protein